MRGKHMKVNSSTTIKVVSSSRLLFVLGVVFLILLVLPACSLGGIFDGDAVGAEGNDATGVESDVLTRNGNYIDVASEQLEAGNLELALEYFEKAILAEEELALAWRGLGLIRFGKFDFMGARVALETSLELGGVETAVVYNILGVSAMRTLDYAGAIAFFDLGIALIDIENIEVMGGMEGIENIESLESLEDSESSENLESLESLESLENLEAMRVMETLQSMMHNRIVAYQRLSNWSGARKAAREYLQIFPDDDAVQREYEFLQTR